MYRVKLKEFQGPLDLLLQFTEENKLDITEISLAKITDQYLNSLKQIENISLESLADFLVIASRLILIKSRMLLPELELTPEEEEDIETLKQRLAKYKQFKELGREIRRLVKQKNISYSREKYCGLNVVFYPPKNLKLIDLENSFKKTLKEIALLEEKLPEEKIGLKISLQEKIIQLQNEITNKIQITFQKLNKQNKSKIETIISFLALLELIKQKLAQVNQQIVFGEIIIKKYEFHKFKTNS